MKIGVIGHLGSIGSRHYANAKKLGHQILAYDPVGGGLNDVSFEKDTYDACDAVIVASPTRFHDQALRACVERGKHILIEKPISYVVGQVPQLLDWADEKNLVVMMGNNLRFHPCVQQVKMSLAAGDIGEPLWASFICATQSRDPYNDGVLLNAGSHEVDLAQYFFGTGNCVSAYSDGNAVVFVLKHESGVRSVFHLDNGTPHRIREFWIAGTDGNIGVDLDARHLSVAGKVWPLGPGSYDDDYVNELNGFIARINGTFAPGATGRDGLATLKTLLDVKKKAGIS